MGKHKKTRQEKMIADLRRKLSLQSKSSLAERNKQLITPPITLKLPDIPASSSTAFIYSHEYLKSDIVKTALLTSSIVIAEVMLFFLLKNHILKLPVIGLN